MVNLNEIKLNLETYHYPWINLINGRVFDNRNLLLQDLKKYLSKDEYKFIYPTKYVFIKNYEIQDIINNSNIINGKILSPLDGKFYNFNNILIHFSRFFNDKDKVHVLYEIFKAHNLVPKCLYFNSLLEVEDIRYGRKAKTKHPDNICFNKYSYKMSSQDYNEIHSSYLKSEEVITKRIKNKKEFLKDEFKRNKWIEKTKNTHKNLDRPWIYNMSDEDRKIKNTKSSESQKRNILEGKFNPQNNYRTKRRIELLRDGKIFYLRSSWEVCFFISHPNLEYESLRIKYNTLGENKIYIPDFIDASNKIIYELKPKRQYISQKDKINL